MGNNKMTDISPAMVNDTLMENVIETLSDSTETYLIHDPSDIRKPHSKKSENLGKVLDGSVATSVGILHFHGAKSPRKTRRL